MPTAIEWCDETFNPWWGCERVSPACAHCYADTFAKRIGMGKLWQNGGEHGFRFFSDKHWAEPLKWARRLPEKLGRRPRVFCASMADVFEERDELEEHRQRLFDLIEQTDELDWLLLTKRPEAARDWLRDAYTIDLIGTMQTEWLMPTNIWLGVSIENPRFTWRADVLREIPAAVRFISAEPLLGSLFPDGVHLGARGRVSVGDVTDEKALFVSKRPLDLTYIDWVIAGGESGHRARSMNLEWARELIAECRARDVACFVKQLGAKPVGGMDTGTRFYLPLKSRKGGDPDEWPEELRVREFPAERPVLA